MLGLDLAQGVVNDAEKVGSRAGGRVQRDNVGVGEAQGLAQPVGQQVVNQADLGADDLNGRVVGPGVLAQLRVVGGQEVFVEVKPRVLRAGGFSTAVRALRR